jgi:hypothetical protein
MLNLRSDALDGCELCCDEMHPHSTILGVRGTVQTCCIESLFDCTRSQWMVCMVAFR